MSGAMALVTFAETKVTRRAGAEPRIEIKRRRCPRIYLNMGRGQSRLANLSIGSLGLTLEILQGTPQ